jgi:hypothetical protein
MDDTTDSKAKGGFARAEALTAEERKKIASKAAKARWAEAKDAPKAEYVGVLKFGDGLEFPCAVLSNGTRVLTETDFMAGMGMYRSGALSVRRKGGEEGGARTPLYLAFKNLIPFVQRHLGNVHAEPLIYRTASGNTAHGIPAEAIPRICEVWLDARKAGVLGPRQEDIATKAEILIRALAQIGIVALVDEATGYQDVRPQRALQQYLEMLIRKELAAWVKRFPDEFYENIYKLKGWQWGGMSKNRFSVVAHYTRDLVYERLAPGVLEELERKTPKNDKGHRSNRLHQWLTEDVGHPMLAQHLHSLLMFQRLAIANGYGWHRFLKMVDQVLPKKGNTLELALNDTEQH